MRTVRVFWFAVLVAAFSQVEAVELCNPQASTEARAVYAYLQTLYGQNILSGQHTYTCDDGFYNRIHSLTGKYPAVWGRDFAGYDGCGSVNEQRQRVVDAARQHWEDGAIITIMWHAVVPGSSVDWNNTKRSWPDGMYDESSTTYRNWIDDIDNIAGFLKQLRDANVPVLWRPYHEMNGGWFWWGGNPQNAKYLWTKMYERYTNHHGLDNLIWVWNVNEKNDWCGPFADYYPGHDYVDMLTVDIYGGYNTHDYTTLVGLADGRPIGFGEVGPIIDPENVKNNWPHAVYFLLWGKCIDEACHADHPYQSAGDVANVYEHDYLLTLDELPDISVPSEPDTEAPTAPGSVEVVDVTATTVELAWTASSDNVRVVRYEVHAAGEKHAETSQTSITVSGLSPQTDYSFLVTAYDAAGNVSAASDPATATTLAPDAITVVNDSEVGDGLNQFDFGGTWHTSTGAGKYQGDDHFSDQAGATLTMRFHGTAIVLYGATASHHGLATVSIDGGESRTIDCYAATRAEDVEIWSSEQLSPGEHELVLTLLGTGNESSGGAVVAIDKMRIINDDGLTALRTLRAMTPDRWSVSVVGDRVLVRGLAPGAAVDLLAADGRRVAILGGPDGRSPSTRVRSPRLAPGAYVIRMSGRGRTLSRLVVVGR